MVFQLHMKLWVLSSVKLTAYIGKKKSKEINHTKLYLFLQSKCLTDMSYHSSHWQNISSMDGYSW